MHAARTAPSNRATLTSTEVHGSRTFRRLVKSRSGALKIVWCHLDLPARRARMGPWLCGGRSPKCGSDFVMKTPRRDVCVVVPAPLNGSATRRPEGDAASASPACVPAVGGCPTTNGIARAEWAVKEVCSWHAPCTYLVDRLAGQRHLAYPGGKPPLVIHLGDRMYAGPIAAALPGPSNAGALTGFEPTQQVLPMRRLAAGSPAL